MKNKIKIYVTIFSTIMFLMVALFFSSEWLFPEWNGSHYLGKNLYMLDWERGNKIIVHCSNKSVRTCYGGSPVIPHNNPREVYVKTAKANEKWIIVRAITRDSNQLCYYLIDKSFNIDGVDWDVVNCDSIIQNQITGPLDLLEFENKTSELGIDLKFK